MTATRSTSEHTRQLEEIVAHNSTKLDEISAILTELSRAILKPAGVLNQPVTHQMEEGSTSHAAPASQTMADGPCGPQTPVQLPTFDEKPPLAENQAIGTVVSAQANFMRVVVNSGEDSGSLGVELLCVVKDVLKKIKRRVLVGDKILPRIEQFTLTRLLVEAESSGIPVTLALNKVELVEEAAVADWKSRLRGWGYEPVFCSVETKRGLDTLKFILRDQTSVIVGPSGVGKSSLINALRSYKSVFGPAEDDKWFEPIAGSKWFEEQPVGEVSTRSGRGNHTTRNVTLLRLSGGGYLADSPGFNQPSLLKVTKHSLARYFPEIRKMLEQNERGNCSFSNCLHIGEPGCLVKGDWERYPYYLQLLDEIKIREEFQLRTFGTKRESGVRVKVGELGVKQSEPRLEPKKHRRQSRKTVNQSLLNELDELDDDDEIDEPVYINDELDEDEESVDTR